MNSIDPQHYGSEALKPQNLKAYSAGFRQNIDELEDLLSDEHWQSLVQLRTDPWNPTLFDLKQKPLIQTVSITAETERIRKELREEKKRGAEAAAGEPALKRQRLLNDFVKKEEE
jgi:hypothetical protein